MNPKLVPHHSHWGAFNAVVEDGKVVGAVPFDFDPDPSPLIDGIADAVNSPTRVSGPMVRAGWLRDGKASGKGRGREPFVQVGWERALDLVAANWCGCGSSMDARDQPRRCARARHRGWRGGARIQRSRGVFRRRGNDGCRAARGGSAFVRRLV